MSARIGRRVTIVLPDDDLAAVDALHAVWVRDALDRGVDATRIPTRSEVIRAAIRAGIPLSAPHSTEER